MLNCYHGIVCEPQKKLTQPEKQLYRIWLEGKFQQEHLKTLSEKPLSIISPGLRNESAGPDFLNALIMLEDQLVSGDIEIHNRNNDWYLHGHDKDENYNNVVLHVIREKTTSRHITNHKNRQIEILLLQPAELFQPDTLCPCKNWGPADIDGFKRIIEDYADKRFQRKTLLTRSNLMQYQPEQYFFMGLLDMLGYSKNREAMRKIADVLDMEKLYQLLEKTPDLERLLFLETIFLGISGMLSDDYRKYFGNDHYFDALSEKWKVLSHQFDLCSVTGIKFQFAGVRPVNAPHKRLVALAQIIHNLYPQKPGQFCLNTLFSGRDFENVIATLKDKFQMPSGMWKNHPLFKSHASLLLLGDSRLNDFISNILLPFAKALSSILKNDHHAALCSENNRKVPVGAFPEKIKDFLRHLSIPPREIKSNYLLQGCIEYYRLFCDLELCNICLLENKN
ncbi:MAG: DUF2851 family protein [Candidatus Marinimicrobia bacterium]|nr:DUF2851 family protein [Candidatus Neomarinimicrobiota bacterium]